MPVLTIAAAALILGEVVTPKIVIITAIILAGTWRAHRHA